MVHLSAPQPRGPFSGEGSCKAFAATRPSSFLRYRRVYGFSVRFEGRVLEAVPSVHRNGVGTPGRSGPRGPGGYSTKLHGFLEFLTQFATYWGRCGGRVDELVSRARCGGLWCRVFVWVCVSSCVC